MYWSRSVLDIILSNATISLEGTTQECVGFSINICHCHTFLLQTPSLCTNVTPALFAIYTLMLRIPTIGYLCRSVLFEPTYSHLNVYIYIYVYTFSNLNRRTTSSCRQRQQRLIGRYQTSTYPRK